MVRDFFITTPIYYSNGIPHVGHAYSSFIADTIARYERMQGKRVKFSTWVDENSQKVVESAKEKNMPIMEYADMMAREHKSVWDGIHIEYTDFIRTTEERHRLFVQKMLTRSYANGDIYEGIYEGKYCVGCEAFKKDSDLIRLLDGKKVEKWGELRCPDHPNKPITDLREKNYFFRLSKYQDRILKWYEEHPDCIIPWNRWNEVKEFVKGGLEDFSISRETNRFGIPLPFDASQVTYVWYDALFNYLTVCQWEEEKWWPRSWSENEVIHVVGKEITRFHAVYWPAMLWSAGYEAPSHLLVTWFFTLDGQKISKSLGNVIDPVEYCTKYSRDALLLYLLLAFPIGEDGDFDRSQAILMYNAKLANNLWNLLHRFTALGEKFWKTLTSDIYEIDTETSLDAYFKYMDHYDLRNALQTAFALADRVNLFLAEKEPWKIRWDDDTARKSVERILVSVGEWLRVIGLMLSPFFPDKMKILLDRIGIHPTLWVKLEESLKTKVTSFTPCSGEPLYGRIDETGI